MIRILPAVLTATWLATIGVGHRRRIGPAGNLLPHADDGLSARRTRSPGDGALAHLLARRQAPPRGQPRALLHRPGPQATALSLTFSPDGRHRHADNLALFYTDRGHTILGDQGYIGDTPMNRWIRSTASHNLVVVDDQEQLKRKGDQRRRPKLHLMATSPRVSVVEASSSVYLQCEQYRRTVALIKGPGAQTFAVDVFRVGGGKKHAWRSNTGERSPSSKARARRRSPSTSSESEEARSTPGACSARWPRVTRPRVSFDSKD